MTLTREQQRPSYPLAAYNFRVTVDGTALSFAKVSGLQRVHHTLVYQHGLSFLEGQMLARYHYAKYIDVTLERGSTIGGKFIYEWLEDRKPRGMEVQLCDAAGAAVLIWRVARAVAVQVTAPTFDASTQEVAIESLQVKAAGITIVHNP